ncbi:MAG: hypothetical protein VST72_07770, partial [Nitrospirota bacterium]|nr:hypothetical protein [Nitrospirota bacterium]
DSCIAGTPTEEPEVTCDDTLDNDCDGLTDAADSDCANVCIPTATDDTTCDGIDDDCDGAVDEDYVSVPTTCGLGVCESSGETVCVDGDEVDSCVAGTPTEDPEVTCDDTLDNDCDGLTDADDSDCEETEPPCERGPNCEHGPNGARGPNWVDRSEEL